MPNVIHEHRRQDLIPGYSIKNTIPNTENKNSNFIVDWQLNNPR